MEQLFCVLALDLPTVPAGLSSDPNGNMMLNVYLRNWRDNRLFFWWINFDGDPVIYGILPPSGTIKVQTFNGHAWLITDDTSDNLIAQFVAYSSDMQIVIE